MIGFYIFCNKKTDQVKILSRNIINLATISIFIPTLVRKSSRFIQTVLKSARGILRLPFPLNIF